MNWVNVERDRALEVDVPRTRATAFLPQKTQTGTSTCKTTSCAWAADPLARRGRRLTVSFRARDTIIPISKSLRKVIPGTELGPVKDDIDASG